MLSRCLLLYQQEVGVEVPDAEKNTKCLTVKDTLMGNSAPRRGYAQTQDDVRRTAQRTHSRRGDSMPVERHMLSHLHKL